MNKKYYTGLVIIVFVLGVFVGIGRMHLGPNKMYYTASNTATGASVNSKANIQPQYTFQVVKMIIDKNYVEKIDDKLYNEMSVDLAKGMLRELGDQNCRFVDEKENKLIDNALKGSFEGVGVRTYIKPIDVNGVEEEKLYIGSVIPGGSAWRSGLRAGDMVLSINDKEILPYDPLGRAELILKNFQKNYQKSKLKDVQNKLENEYKRIENGISILEAEKLLAYKGDKPVKIKTNRGEWTLTSSSWKLDSVKKNVYNNIPYIHIQYLSNETGNLLKNYLSQCKKNKVIILDLRDVFGGTYESGSEVAKYFVPNTNLGVLKTKDSEILLKVPQNSTPWKGQTIILVNKGTNKYGELLANAIGRNTNSVILGEETLGNLKDITIYSLGKETGFTLTTGEYILKNKVKNVVPKIKITPGLNGKELGKKDLDKALAYLGGKK